MIAMAPTRIPGRRRGKKASTPPRKPDPQRFASLVLRMPAAPGNKTSLVPLAIAALLAAGMAFGAAWNRNGEAASVREEIFVMEEELPPPPPEPPPTPPDPEPPPKVEAKVEPPPPPQFGMEEDALGETGDLAVAAGNTIMKEAEPIIAPPPPPLPAAPVFVDQAPRILAGDPPEYPARALDRGLEGTVVALITIDTNGIVGNVSIEKSAGPDFDGAVLKSARQTRFQAPIRDGRKVPARFRRPFEFGLE